MPTSVTIGGIKLNHVYRVGRNRNNRHGLLKFELLDMALLAVTVLVIGLSLFISYIFFTEMISSYHGYNPYDIDCTPGHAVCATISPVHFAIEFMLKSTGCLAVMALGMLLITSCTGGIFEILGMRSGKLAGRTFLVAISAVGVFSLLYVVCAIVAGIGD